MRLYTKAYRDGYKDYVFGFSAQESDPSYLEGFNRARSDFMNDRPYDEDLNEGYQW